MLLNLKKKKRKTKQRKISEFFKQTIAELLHKKVINKTLKNLKFQGHLQQLSLPL